MEEGHNGLIQYPIITQSTVLVLSIGFNGCLAHPSFYKAKQNDPSLTITKANKPFLWQLAREIQDTTPELVIVMNGSHRQSADIDNQSMTVDQHGYSIFKELPTVNNFFADAVLDSALLSDVFCNLEFGESWELATSEHPELFPGTPIFETKIPQVFFQMQRVASGYGADKTVTFKFFNHKKSVLDAVNTYYSNYPFMIPIGMSLSLEHYAGESCTHISTITGTGVPDPDFRKTVIAFTIAANQPVLSGWQLRNSPKISFSAEPSRLCEIVAGGLEAYQQSPIPTLTDNSSHSMSLAQENTHSQYPKRFFSWSASEDTFISPMPERTEPRS